MPSRVRSGSRASTNVARPRSQADQMLLAQTREQLQEKERVPPRAVGQGQQGVVGSGAEDVSRYFGNSARLEAPENRLDGPVAKQLGDGAPQIVARLDGSEGQHPADRHRSQAGRQGAYRGPCAAVCPLQVVEADQDRLAKRGLLEQRLDVLQHPVPLLPGGMRIPERGTVEQRLSPAEQRVHQHGQLYGRVAGLGHPVADSETSLPRGRHGLFDQAALTQSRAAFNQPAGPGSAPEPGQVIVQRGHLDVPAAQRVRHGTVRSGNRARRGPRCGVQDVSAHFGRPILARISQPGAQSRVEGRSACPAGVRAVQIPPPDPAGHPPARSISLGYRWRGEEVLDGRWCECLASRKCELPTQ